MAVSLTFGLPGSGKTTIMCADILRAMKSGRYKNYYCNVHVKIPGVTYIDNDCIGKYELRDCALFIDEATLFADSRNHKEFSEGRKSYFLEHRHRCADIWLYTQQWNGVDLKIRAITDRVFYIRKGFWTGKWLSSCYRVPYDILFPDPKRGNEKLGEIVQGYCKPSFLHRLFARRIWRPKYYRYFDSWDLDPFPPLPERYQPYCPVYETNTKKLFCCVRWLRKKGTGCPQPMNAYGPPGPQNTGFVSFGYSCLLYGRLFDVPEQHSFFNIGCVVVLIKFHFTFTTILIK